jgi:ParB-like chromosome segregation protein Spo0J
MTRVITAPVETLPIEEIDLRFAPLRLVHPTQLERLMASVKRDGVREPVLAATEVEAPRRVLVDGFKRVRVARELGMARLNASLLALDGPAALAMMVRANAAQRGMSALEEGWVVRQLCREHGLTQAKAGALLEREQSWVSLRLRLVEQLEEALQEDLRLGLLTPSVARELGRLPRAEQLRAAEVVREQGLLSRQATRLVRCLLATDDPAVRRAILADPGRFIAVASAALAQERTIDSRLTTGGNKLRQSLLCFEGAASRLGSRLLSDAAEDLSGEATRILGPLLRQASAAGSRVVTLLNEAGRGGDRARGAVAEASATSEGTAHAQPQR